MGHACYDQNIKKDFILTALGQGASNSFVFFDDVLPRAIKKYGGKVLARGPVADRLEGDVDGIVMMIEFESKEAADTFYHSKEYQAAKAVREECSDTDLMIAEGVPD